MRRRRIPFLIRSFCLINTKRMRKEKNAEFTKTQQLMEIDSEIEQNKEIMDDFIDTILEIHESIMGNKECSFSLQTVDKARKHQLS